MKRFEKIQKIINTVREIFVAVLDKHPDLTGNVTINFYTGGITNYEVKSINKIP